MDPVIDVGNIFTGLAALSAAVIAYQELKIRRSERTAKEAAEVAVLAIRFRNAFDAIASPSNLFGYAKMDPNDPTKVLKETPEAAVARPFQNAIDAVFDDIKSIREAEIKASLFFPEVLKDIEALIKEYQSFKACMNFSLSNWSRLEREDSKKIMKFLSDEERIKRDAILDELLSKLNPHIDRYNRKGFLEKAREIWVERRRSSG